MAGDVNVVINAVCILAGHTLGFLSLAIRIPAFLYSSDVLLIFPSDTAAGPTNLRPNALACRINELSCAIGCEQDKHLRLPWKSSHAQGAWISYEFVTWAGVCNKVIKRGKHWQRYSHRALGRVSGLCSFTQV